jgi:hypothetical protein
LYDKGERTLRAEVVVHNSKELGCKRSLEHFGLMVTKLEGLMNNFVSNLTYAHVATIDDDTMEDLNKPVEQGKSKVSGINITHSRNVALMESVLTLLFHPKGFGAGDLVAKMKQRGFKDYSISSARYDMRKLKAKEFIEKIKGKQKHRLTHHGIETISAALCVWKQQLKPFMKIVKKKDRSNFGEELNKVESHFFNARTEIHQISDWYGLKIAS